MAVYKALNNTTYTTKTETTVTIDSDFTNPYRHVVISSPLASCGAIAIYTSHTANDINFSSVVTTTAASTAALIYQNISDRCLNSSVEVEGKTFYGTRASSFGYVVFSPDGSTIKQTYPGGKMTVTRATPDGVVLTNEYTIEAGEIAVSLTATSYATIYFNVYKANLDTVLAITFEPDEQAESEVTE